MELIYSSTKRQFKWNEVYHFTIIIVFIQFFFPLSLVIILVLVVVALSSNSSWHMAGTKNNHQMNECPVMLRLALSLSLRYLQNKNKLSSPPKFPSQVYSDRDSNINSQRSQEANLFQLFSKKKYQLFVHRLTLTAKKQKLTNISICSLLSFHFN